MKYLNKYLPDALFLAGVLVVSYNFVRHTGLVLPSLEDDHTEKVLGIMLIAFAINIAVRRYFTKKNSE